MELATKTKQISFREWYNSLDSLGKIKFRDQFMNISGIKYPTFYSKLQRNTRLSFNDVIFIYKLKLSRNTKQHQK